MENTTGENTQDVTQNNTDNNENKVETDVLYEGKIENGKAHGYGKLVFPNGTVYEGNFENGNYHGHGKLVFPNGTVYEGNFENGNYHGHGTLRLANGLVYKGEFQNALYNGYGIATVLNGSTYEGYFKDGKNHGHGKVKYANGTEYEGDFENGEYHGEGTLKLSNELVYKGGFKDGKYDGYGTLNILKKREYRGGFKDGKHHGHGKIKYTNGTEYEGDFENGEYHGEGNLLLADGRKYKGNFQGGKFNEYGEFYIPKVGLHKGLFKDGIRHGHGKVTYDSGATYEAYFLYGKPHGKVTYESKNVKLNGMSDNGIIKDFNIININDVTNTEHTITKSENGAYFYKNSDNNQEVEIDFSQKNRLFENLLQLGNANINATHQDSRTPEELKAFIESQIEESLKNEGKPLVKLSSIPSHAFTMIFQNGKAFCFDNHGLLSEDMSSYANVIQANKNVNLTHLRSDATLSMILKNKQKIKIRFDTRDYVCRHRASSIYCKLNQLIEENPDIKSGKRPLIEAFNEYLESVFYDGQQMRATSPIPTPMASPIQEKKTSKKPRKPNAIKKESKESIKNPTQKTYSLRSGRQLNKNE